MFSRNKFQQHLHNARMCNKIFVMRLKRANITNLIIFAIIAVCLYLIQRIAVFDLDTVAQPFANFREQTYAEYTIAFACLIGLSVWLALVERKKGLLRIHVPLIVLLIGLFTMSAVTIISFPEVLKVDVPVYNQIVHTASDVETGLDFVKHVYIYVTPEQKVLYLICTFSVLYLTYIFLWVLPRKIRCVRALDLVMYIIITLGTVALIYSLIFDAQKYYQFFVALRDPDLYFPYGINSFLGNRNSFGMLMSFSCFASIYLHHTTKKWWFLPIAFVYFIETIFITSKTNMLICLFVLVVYLIGYFILTFKKNLKRSIIILSVVGGLLLIFGGLYLVHVFVNSNFMNFIFKYVDKVFDFFFVNAIQNTNSFTGRDRQYGKVMILLNFGYWATGLGYGLFGYIFQGMENFANVETLYVLDSSTVGKSTSPNTVLSESPHSSYYQILGSGGIVTFVVYGLLILYVIFAMVRIFKQHKLTVIMCASFLGAAILHGFTEAPTLFFVGPTYVDSLMFTIFVTTPVLSLYYHSKHPSENRKFLADYEPVDTKLENYKSPNLISKSIYLFLALPVIIICFVCPIYWNPLLEENRILLIGMIIVGSLFVLAPIVAKFVFERDGKYKEFFLDIVLPYYVVVIVFGGFAILYRVLVGPYTLTLTLLMALFLFVGYVILFTSSKYMAAKAGIISRFLDMLCNINYKHQSKYIELSDEKDSFTLEEKLFWYITPKKFRRNETRDN